MKIKILCGLFIGHNEILKNRQSIWFLQGFADSGLVYKEVFDSSLSYEFDLYVVDLPGFGVSPRNIETRKFLKQENIPNRLYKEIGYWHRVENSTTLYNENHSIVKMA